MNKTEQEILKLFVNEYDNVDVIAIKLNISEEEVIKVLDKYQDEINKYSIQNMLFI